MPNRQYFCWKMCLKFHCGCIEYTSTQHVCNANRGVVCHRWMVTRTTDKNCDAHRISGLHGDGSDDDSASSLLSTASPPSWDEGEWTLEAAGDEEEVYGGQQQQQQQEEKPAEVAQRRVSSEGGHDTSQGSYERGPRRRAAN